MEHYFRGRVIEAPRDSSAQAAAHTKLGLLPKKQQGRCPLLHFLFLGGSSSEEKANTVCIWVVLNTGNRVWEDRCWGSCQRLAELVEEEEGSTWYFKMFSEGGYTGDGSLNMSKELENKISHSSLGEFGFFPGKYVGNLAGSGELQETLWRFHKGALSLESTSKMRIWPPGLSTSPLALQGWAAPQSCTWLYMGSE